MGNCTESLTKEPIHCFSMVFGHLNTFEVVSPKWQYICCCYLIALFEWKPNPSAVELETRGMYFPQTWSWAFADCLPRHCRLGLTTPLQLTDWASLNFNCLMGGKQKHLGNNSYHSSFPITSIVVILAVNTFHLSYWRFLFLLLLICIWSCFICTMAIVCTLIYA